MTGMHDAVPAEIDVKSNKTVGRVHSGTPFCFPNIGWTNTAGEHTLSSSTESTPSRLDPESHAN